MSGAIAVAVAAAKTSTGHQDITTMALSGVTPKAVLFIYSRANADATINANSGMSYGAADGTNQFAYAGFCQDYSNSASVGYTDGCIAALANTSTVHSKADFVGFIANGCTVNWSVASTDAWLVTALFFSGTDWTAGVGQAAIPATTTLSWQPDCVMLFNAGTYNGDGAIQSGLCRGSFGAATFNGNVAGKSIYSAFFKDSDNTWNVQRSDPPSSNYCGFEYGPANDGPWIGNYFVSCSRSSTGFTLTGIYNTPPINRKFGYLALKYTGVGIIKAGSFNLSQSSGAQSFTGFGGKPGGFLMLLPREELGEVLDWRFGFNVNSGTKGGGFATSGHGVNLVAANSDQESSTANNDSVTLLDWTGTKNLACTLTSFDANGITLNFSTAPTFKPQLGPAYAGMNWPYLTIINYQGAGLAQRAWGTIID